MKKDFNGFAELLHNDQYLNGLFDKHQLASRTCRAIAVCLFARRVEHYTVYKHYNKAYKCLFYTLRHISLTSRSVDMKHVAFFHCIVTLVYNPYLLLCTTQHVSRAENSLYCHACVYKREINPCVCIQIDIYIDTRHRSK